MRKPLVALFLITALIALNPSIPVIADDPGTWTKTDGLNEISPALTEGTATFEDDEGGEFVHGIQWDKVAAFADEDAWKTAADIDLDMEVSAEEALDWVYDNVDFVDDNTHYGVDEAWANPEQTLNQASGDSEDMAFLLASLLEFHTDGVAADDLVYAACAFLPPPVDGFHAWVYWYDASETAWHELDPTIPAMNGLPYPSFGTLWLNDELVWGFLAGYYPGSLPRVAGYEMEDFRRIAEGGFGDPMNNYAWSMTYFDDDLYVGTGRHVPWRVFLALFGPAFEFQHITAPSGAIGEQQWAEDMRGEIWRYGSWERVYQAPVVGGPPFAPRESGFRAMTTFQGEIYAASGGGYVKGGLLLKSADGVAWQQVVTPPEMGTDSRAMVVHNGKLCVGTGYQGKAEVWAFPSNPDPWERVANFSAVDVDLDNLSVTSLESFNGHLYAGTTNIMDGYQVFKSDAQLSNWTQLVDYGGGDKMNYMAGTMEVFNGHLYVGSMSLPVVQEDGTFKPGLPKGFELIRIDPGDTSELIIGDYVPRLKPPDGAALRLPASRWPGGFANPLNHYCWSLRVDNGVLYLGTFDSSSFLHLLPSQEVLEPQEYEGLVGWCVDCQEQIIAALEQVIGLLNQLGVEREHIEPFEKLLEAYNRDPVDPEEVLQVFVDYFAGGDLWKTEDGSVWEPVTLNGFDNPQNYGMREIIHANPLFVGTANPFEGLEIWRAPAPEPVGGIAVSADKAGLLAPWMSLVALFALAGTTVALVRRRIV